MTYDPSFFDAHVLLMIPVFPFPRPENDIKKPPT